MVNNKSMKKKNENEGNLKTYVKDNDTYEEYLAAGGLKLVECYAAWSGDCAIIPPLYQKLREVYDSEVLSFLACTGEAIPSLSQYKGKSQPTFLFYRNGNLKETIHGVNFPKLEEKIRAMTPPDASLDSLEDNPIYLARKNEAS